MMYWLYLDNTVWRQNLMNNSLWRTLRPLQLNSFIALARVTIFTAAVLICAEAAAQAQLGTNPVGTSVTLGPSDNFNGNNTATEDRDGYDNYGHVKVAGARYGKVTVDVAEFNHNEADGLDNEPGSSATIEDGTFDYNATGVYDNDSIDSISGGTFDFNFGGLFSESSTVSISGGNFNNNEYGLSVESSTDSISGGDFSGNVESDLVTDDGTIDIYGESFLGEDNGVLPSGDLPEGAGSFYWTPPNEPQDQEYITYYNGGTIDLFYGAPAAAPAPEASSLAVFAGLALGFGALVVCARRKRAVTD
jgi:hypothetical protein